jgi:hypothetical protein
VKEFYGGDEKGLEVCNIKHTKGILPAESEGRDK